jgi:hypothetical protein
MTVVERLTEIVSALEELNVPHLIMGGHAVRYYGFNRETTDHDLHIPAAAGRNLSDILSKTTLFLSAPPTEAPTWRGEDFRRFVLGLLPDGKEELLEFWIRNHLLDDFEKLYDRREEGMYGGMKMPFLSLPDLIRSKETERESDWEDIKILEGILDHRNIAAVKAGGSMTAALSTIRSVRGLELAVNAGLTAGSLNAKAALQVAQNPITQALLIPFAPEEEPALPESELLPVIFRRELASVSPCSTRHLTFVNAVWLRYKRAMKEIDRQEKIARRERLNSP